MTHDESGHTIIGPVTDNFKRFKVIAWFHKAGSWIDPSIKVGHECEECNTNDSR